MYVVGQDMYTNYNFYLLLSVCLKLFHILPKQYSSKKKKKKGQKMLEEHYTLSQENYIFSFSLEAVIQCNIKSFSAVLMAVQSSLASSLMNCKSCFSFCYLTWSHINATLMVIRLENILFPRRLIVVAVSFRSLYVYF